MHWNHRSLTVAGSLALFFGLGGCATTGSIETAEELARASDGSAGTLVFGRFQLVRNGHDVQLGGGIFANTARLYLQEADERREITGSVGRDGEFAWMLAPGSYRITSIGFRHHGQNIEPMTNFTFTVPDGHRASYAGTIRLEATLDRNYLGTRARVERYTISNDCATECPQRLDEVGLSADEATVALFDWQQQVALTSPPAR